MNGTYGMLEPLVKQKCSLNWFVFVQLWQPFWFFSFSWSVVFPVKIAEPLNIRTSRISKKKREETERFRVSTSR